MSRRLPNCAGCGKPMAKAKARCIQTFTGVKGSPVIGTCWGTDKENPGRCMDSVPALHGPAKVALAPVLRMIAARGPGRVLLIGKATLDEACADAARLDAQRAGKA
jgi:hypothetical protein